MADRAGFVIADRFYPVPDSFRLADPVLIEELTGLAWDEFVDRLPSGDEDGADPVALVGLVGVAVWQQNPRWRRDRVVRFVEQIQQDALAVEGGDEEANGGPPAEAAGATRSATSASSSESDSESGSETSPPKRSGTQTSPTSPEEQSE